MIRLSKSGIEYLDYVWNFYSGCENWRLANRCEVGQDCWAMGITKRFESHYPKGFEPTFYPDAFLSPLDLKKPNIIGVCFMGDLFGDWVDPNMVISLPDSHGETFANQELRSLVFAVIRACPQHTFVFLTKCPWNLPKWSPFPENCWVGVTATDTEKLLKALSQLEDVQAKIKFVSIEPLLDWDFNFTQAYLVNCIDRADLGWLTIGQQTPISAKTQPEIEWIQEIVEAAEKAGIPIFLKDNLRPLLIKDKDCLLLPTWAAFCNEKTKHWELRQEFPKEVPCKK